MQTPNLLTDQEAYSTGYCPGCDCVHYGTVEGEYPIFIRFLYKMSSIVDSNIVVVIITSSIVFAIGQCPSTLNIDT